MAWTLKAALSERGLSIKQAARLCDMDVPTMEILAGGGKTLPCLALRVAKGLGLSREQTMTIGQPLDKTKWGRGSGLPSPRPVDVDPAWYERVPEKERKGDLIRRVWLDTGAVAMWMIEQGRDVSEWMGCQGCRYAPVNRMADKSRLVKIRELERQLNIPRAIAETDQDMSGVHVRLLWRPNTDRINDAVRQEGNTYAVMADRLRRTPGFEHTTAGSARGLVNKVLCASRYTDLVTTARADAAAAMTDMPRGELFTPLLMVRSLAPTGKKEQGACSE